MTKYEFTENLRKALTGRLNPASVDSNVSYYENYIDAEIRKGKSEQEVLEFLGDPRMIARNITDNASIEDASTVHGPDPSDSHSFKGEANKDNKKNWKYFELPPIAVMFLVVLIVIVVGYLISFLAPLIIILGFIIWLLKRFRKK